MANSLSMKMLKLENRIKATESEVKSLRRRVNTLEVDYAPRNRDTPRVPLTPRPDILAELQLGSEPTAPEIEG